MPAGNSVCAAEHLMAVGMEVEIGVCSLRRAILEKESFPCMRGFKLILALVLMAAGASVVSAQSQTFTNNDIEYALELPSQVWKVIARPDSVHQHLEFVNGERGEGFLRIRKEVVEAGSSPSALATRDQDVKLRFIPGFVQGKQERFSGRLNGVTASYEFTSAGKPMVGRIYYLQADNRTIYTLHFTGRRDNLLRIRNQTDSIARSFHLK